MEKKPGNSSYRKIGQASPSNHPGMAVQDRVDGVESSVGSGSGWSRFWLIWVSIFVACSGCVMFAWVYFPQNKVVQKSQEYVMVGLLSVISVWVFTIMLKLVWQYCRGTQKRSLVHFEDVGPEIQDGWVDDCFSTPCGEPYYSEEMPDQQPGIGVRSYMGHMHVPAGQPGQPSDVVGSNQVQGLSPGGPSLARAEPNSGLAREAISVPGDQCGPIMAPHQVGQPQSSVEETKGVSHSQEYPVRRTFSGSSEDVWNEFLQYFENLAELNAWNPEKSRRILLSTLRGQAETYAYGLALVYQRSYDRLKQKMDERFGHTAMKEKYIAEAKLRTRKAGESLRDFGQALEDLYRRAYPENPDIVEENAIKAFLDKCGHSEDFRLAVKRTRPKTLQNAVINAMQEECLRVGEKDLAKEKPANRPIYEVDDGRAKVDMITNASESQIAGITEHMNFYGRGDHRRYFQRYPGRGPQGRPFNRRFQRGRGRSEDVSRGPSGPAGQESVPEGSESKPLN